MWICFSCFLFCFVFKSHHSAYWISSWNLQSKQIPIHNISMAMTFGHHHRRFPAATSALTVFSLTLLDALLLPLSLLQNSLFFSPKFLLHLWRNAVIILLPKYLQTQALRARVLLSTPVIYSNPLFGSGQTLGLRFKLLWGRWICWKPSPTLVCRFCTHAWRISAFLTALFLGPLPFATGPLVLILYHLLQYHLFDYFSPAITCPKQK